MKVDGILTIHNFVKNKSKERGIELVTEGKTDIGKLENIVEKPDLMLFGTPSKYDTPIRKASCLMEGLVRKHAFTDGNKRTAIYTVYAYLQKEGIKLDIKKVKTSFMVYIASDKARDEQEIDMLIDEIEFYLTQRII